jgi:hypothetical protein
MAIARRTAVSALLLALAACGADPAADSTSAPTTHSISGAGLTLQIPAEWSGRIVQPAGNSPNVLQAASVPLLPFDDSSGGDNIIDALPAGATFINVLDYGPPAAWMTTDPRWAGTLAVHITAADLDRAGSAVDPKREAIDDVIANGHALVVTVAFGEANPTASDITAANAVVSSLGVAPNA